MTDYRLSDLLDMSIIQKLADSNFSVSGLPMTITDAVDGTILVKSGWPGICTYFHRANQDSHAQCNISDSVVNHHLDKATYQYRCNNGLWHIAMPVTVAGKHMATLFLTQFWFDYEKIDRKYFANQAIRYGFDMDGYMAALDSMPVFSQEKVDYIVAYDRALVKFISDLAEHSLREIEGQYELKRAYDLLEMRVKERTADLEEANRLLLIEIAERKHYESKLKELSEVDHLTMISNRRKLIEVLVYEMEKAKRYARPLSLIMLDLDHFKKINDTYGHNAGDSVLITTVQIINDILRKTDVFARYGGEEFIILCTESGQDGATALAEKIRVAIENFNYHIVGKVTISAGVAEFNGESCETDFINKADSALYSAKRLGRNMVVDADSKV
jgi:diguanylate cyclase (GGDEF)-like protein